MTREALKEEGVASHIHVVRDGVEAMAFLRREAAYADAPRPDLILLDLNLPRKNGHEVLQEVKADQDLRRTPVIVFTTSRAEDDITRSYDLHANGYIAKPADLDGLLAAARSINQFWFNFARLPPREESPTVGAVRPRPPAAWCE